ncbi:MAG: response regulator [Verrucomicrobia bacterium]|nr:response regulator [Verrucomicrobiota bacterium]
MTELKRILLVEDNLYDVELALTALAEHRLAGQVAVTHDGVEALDYLHGRGHFAGRGQDLPAVVLLDLKMPRMDGLEVLRLLKGDPHLRKVPVVMLTSSREESDLVRSYDLGVNAYIVKPVDFGQFVSAVKQLGLFWAVINEPPPGTAGRAG